MPTAREGDRIEFDAGRHGRVQGVITRVVYGERRKAKAMLARHGISDPSLTDNTYYEVHDDQGRSWRKVPERLAKVIGKADPKTFGAARAAVSAIARQNRDVQLKQRSANWDAAGDMSSKLKPGDKVRVKFKSPYGGTTIRELTFVKWSNNGRLLVKTDFGQEKWIYPQSVVPHDIALFGGQP